MSILEQKPEPSLRESIGSAIDESSTGDTGGGDGGGGYSPPVPAGNAPAGGGDAGGAGYDPNAASADRQGNVQAQRGAPAGQVAPQGPVKAPPGFPDPMAWASMPPAIQKWTMDRERQYAKGLQGNANAASFGMTIANAIKPYQWMLEAKGVPPAQLVKEAMQFHAILSSGSPVEKASMLVRAAQHYGIDPRILLEGNGGEGVPQPHPEVANLKQQLQAMQQYLRGNMQQQVTQEASQAWTAVDRFAQDPQFPHAEQLLNEMADLLERGFAHDLPSAYQKALAWHPELYAVGRGADAARRQREARAAAAGSTTYGGAPMSGSANPSDESLRATLERLMG